MYYPKAYPTNKSYGLGWECNRGYLEVDKTCRFVKVPSNAYLNSRGDGWKCDRGHRKVKEICVAIKVPSNGYLNDSSYGSDWKCDRGYRAVDGICVAVEVPANGYLSNSSSGSGWECDRRYRAVDGACVGIKVPENGYSVDASSGPGWTAIAGTGGATGLASPWRWRRTLISIIPETTGNVTALTASKRVSALCLEGIRQDPFAVSLSRWPDTSPVHHGLTTFSRR